MNDLNLSMRTKELLAAAKADVPGAAVRGKMWAGVSGTLGGAVGTATAVSTNSVMSASAGAGAMKLLTMGALFGGTITVGIAATMLYLRPASTTPTPLLDPVPMGAAVHAAAAPAAPAAAPLPAAIAAASETAPPSTPLHAAPAADSEPLPLLHPRRSPHGPRAPKGAPREDALGREASLVSQARAALGRGDPRAALRAVRAARALPAHQLDPEELAVEELALRALGESDQANGIQVQLRLQYPEADLGR